IQLAALEEIDQQLHQWADSPGVEDGNDVGRTVWVACAGAFNYYARGGTFCIGTVGSNVSQKVPLRDTVVSEANQSSRLSVAREATWGAATALWQTVSA
ncbi:hypothetical protein PENNAL_c0314G00983, partial [Penicillium nalgiovense]